MNSFRRITTHIHHQGKTDVIHFYVSYSFGHQYSINNDEKDNVSLKMYR